MKAAAAILLVLSYLSYCHGWNCKAAPQQPSAVQIDAGEGQVVMTDKFFNAFFLTGSSWSKLSSVPLQHVTVGPAGIWGAGPSNQVYKYVGGDFIPVNGQNLQQVDAGGSVQIVGTYITETIYCLSSSGALLYQQPGNVTWTNISGLLKFFSCGPNGCWGTNFADSIFFTQITPATCAQPNVWTGVPGSAKTAEVATDGTVIIVNSLGQAYQRVGMSSIFPQGVDWVQIPISLPIISASYDLGRLWLVTDNSIILQCTP